MKLRGNSGFVIQLLEMTFIENDPKQQVLGDMKAPISNAN